jgi:hypothetical protein
VTWALRAWRWLTGEAWRFDPVGAGIRVPAIVFGCVLGCAIGGPIVGALIAGGAYTVGFGAIYELRGSRVLLLSMVSAGIGATAIVGSLAGAHLAAAVVLAAVLGLLCGRLASRGAGAGWLALQCGLAGMIATGYPTTLSHAAARAALIVAGGLTQTAALALAELVHARPEPSPADAVVPAYAVRITVALSAAMLLERTLPLRNGFWVPMTVLLVLRPGDVHTVTRIFMRVGGTIGGAALASATIAWMRPIEPVVAVFAAAAAFGSYVFQRASYGLLSTFITGYVVFSLSFVGQKEGTVAVARVVATVIGAAIALAVQIVRPEVWAAIATKKVAR